MPISRHTFAKLDTDSDASRLDSSSFIAGLNIALEPGYVRPQTGNVAVAYALPAGTNQVVGSCEDNAGGVLDFVCNSNGNHQLTRTVLDGGARTLLLQWSGLALSPNRPVLGAAVLDGLLVYLDANGALRSVSVARAAAGYYTPSLLLADPYALHLVKQPPHLGPTCAFETESPAPVTNLVGSRTWQFAVRYRYLDGEITVLSPRSRTLYAPPYAGMSVANSTVIRVHLTEPPSPLVESVDVLVREDSSSAWLVAQELRRDATSGAFPDLLFRGVTTGGAITDAEAVKFAEAVPLKTGAMCVAGSRVVAGDCEEGQPETAPVLAVQAVGGDGPRTFHERSGYRFGVQFVDALGLPGGVVGIQSMITPRRTEEYSLGGFSYDQLATGGGTTLDQLATLPSVTHVQWNLPTTDPDTLNAEIPAWATHYHVVTSRGQRAGFFLQVMTADILSYHGDDSDGTPILTAMANVLPTAPLWLDIGNLPYSQMGYTFDPASNDRVYLVAENVEANILYQHGDYIAIDYFGVPLSRNAHIEIFTPLSGVGGEGFYEEPGMGFPVVRTPDPTSGVERRSYSSTSGVLAGDSFIVQRNFARLFMPNPNTGSTAYNPPKQKTYSLGIPSGGGQYDYKGWVEAMTPNAKNYETWLDGTRNRVSYAVPGGNKRVKRRGLLRFTGVKVQGTHLNGLGSFEPLSQYDELPQEQGAVTRLSVADQTQSEGSILLVNQERGTESLGMGRGQIQTGDGDVLITISKQVFGSGNALRGGFGCTDPATVVPYAGKVFYFCRQREEVLRYDRNGVTPLALTYKARQRLSAAFRLYAAARISGCFDPNRKEYILSFHAVGELPGLTLVYSDRYEAWADALSAVPEAGQSVGSELVTWKNGALWRHTPTAPQCSFYGVVTPATLTFTTAQPGGVAKQFKDVAVETTGPLWRPTALATDTQLISRTIGAWFTHREGVYRAGLRRAENSPGFTTIYHALDNGAPLVGSRLTTTLTAPTNALPLTACSISWVPRSGQLMGV